MEGLRSLDLLWRFVRALCIGKKDYLEVEVD